jgi:dipeptidyl aminopeptidase/acylaminoacyl peptidase
MPAVEPGDESYRWRRVWLYELASNTVRQLNAPQANIWEAVWCGNDAIAAVVSPGPGEGLWYSARLHRIDIRTGETRELYKPADQLGCPAATPSGKHVAVVEAICSDRWIVAGDLKMIDTASGKARPIDTRSVDVTYTEWRSDKVLLVTGHRGFETVVALYDLTSATFTEQWTSRDVTTGGRYITVSGLNETGDCVLVGESFTRAPEVALIRGGQYRTLKSFDAGYAEAAKAIAAVEAVTWKAPDGLEIQTGWKSRAGCSSRTERLPIRSSSTFTAARSGSGDRCGWDAAEPAS